jgi:MFS family permease
MYTIIGLGASAGAIGGPAKSALLPQIVPTAIFSNAVAWNSSFFQIASVVGPAIGGFMLRYTVSGVYVVDAAFAMVFAVGLLFLHVRPAERTREPASFRTLTEGIRFVWKNQIIFATISLDLFAVLLGGAVFLLPIFADRLGVGAVGFGWLRAAPAIGAFLMAIFITHLPPMKHAGRAMLLAVAAYGAATVVFGLSHWFWLSFVMLFLTGAFDNISVVVRHTLVQVLAPDSMRGRISAVNNVFIGASNEIGGFESGLTANLFGPVLSVVGGGIGTILVVLAAAGLWPQLRKFGSLHDAQPIEHEEGRGFEVIAKSAEPATQGLNH